MSRPKIKLVHCVVIIPNACNRPGWAAWDHASKLAVERRQQQRRDDVVVNPRALLQVVLTAARYGRCCTAQSGGSTQSFNGVVVGWVVIAIAVSAIANVANKAAKHVKQRRRESQTQQRT